MDRIKRALRRVGVYLILVAFLANPVMEGIMLSAGYDFWGTMVAAVALTFLPVALLAALSPFFVRLLLKELEYGGRITGAVYGVSTMGNVLGTLVTELVRVHPQRGDEQDNRGVRRRADRLRRGFPCPAGFRRGA